MAALDCRIKVPFFTYPEALLSCCVIKFHPNPCGEQGNEKCLIKCKVCPLFPSLHHPEGVTHWRLFSPQDPRPFIPTPHVLGLIPEESKGPGLLGRTDDCKGPQGAEGALAVLSIYILLRISGKYSILKSLSPPCEIKLLVISCTFKIN